MLRPVDRATLPTKPAPAAPATPRPARWLALGAVASPILFTLTWIVLGFVSPGYTLFGTRIAPYSPVSQPISGLGLGDTAPFMNGAFILGGLLLFAGVMGVFQTIGSTPRPAARRASRALSPRHPRLAAVRQLAAARQPADAGTGGPLLPDLRPDSRRRTGGGGRPHATAAGRRSPRLVRRHGLAGVPPVGLTIGNPWPSRPVIQVGSTRSR
jgi:hypothetical protein